MANFYKDTYRYEKLKALPDFIGREFELKRIAKTILQKDPNITIVYGRRRVGKTELIETALAKRKVWKFEGLENQSSAAQRQNVLDQLAFYTQDLSVARLQLNTWREVFRLIAEALEGSTDIVVYLEELQWMANYRKALVSDLKYVWDNYFRKIPGFKLILCGSATSFMIKKVVKSKALYSRSIYTLPLEPLSINEASQLLKNYSDLHTLQAYLLFGGIPEYLKYVKNYETPIITLAEEGFTPGGYFFSEYEKIFISSLNKYATHKSLIELFSRQNFYTRSELAKKTNISVGGRLTEVLNDLEVTGLINKLKPYNGRKHLYFLQDPYLNLYLKIIKPKFDNIKQGLFKKKLNAINYSVIQQYLGYSLERFCRQQHYGLAEILGISGIEYSHSPLNYQKKSEQGFQFDLVFDRKDKCLTLFEIKFKQEGLSVGLIGDFEKKLNSFVKPKNYNIQKVLISAGEVSETLVKSYYFDRVIGLSELVRID